MQPLFKVKVADDQVAFFPPSIQGRLSWRRPGETINSWWALSFLYWARFHSQLMEAVR